MPKSTPQSASPNSARFFDSPDQSLFFSCGDPEDPRLGDLVRALDLEDNAQSLAAIDAAVKAGAKCHVLAGYPDDEGVHINGGRQGAAAGPNTVRKYLYKMTPALLNPGLVDRLSLLDLGNLDLTPPLLERHQRVQSMVTATLQSGAKWIGIGGGHDYGFADAAGFIEWAQSQQTRPLVLNFDAHLDVRPTSRGISSGTPFFRMLEAYPEVDFAEIGIQTQCNSQAHLRWAKNKGARVITQEEVLVSGQSFATSALNLLDEWLMKPRPVYLSVDIDGFSSQAAPGCSQSWSTGFLPSDFFAVLANLLPRLDVKVLGIYEVAPPLDRDDQTSKLAAQIVHRVITQ